MKWNLHSIKRKMKINGIKKYFYNGIYNLIKYYDKIKIFFNISCKRKSEQKPLPFTNTPKNINICPD